MKNFINKQRNLKVFTGSSEDNFLRAEDSNDTLYGVAGDDTLYGVAGDDTLYGGVGNDYLRGGVGNDYLRGGAGDDELYGGDGNNILNGGDGDDILKGRAGDDTLEGGAGDDKLYGKAGDDWLEGGDGDDILDGGTGYNDRATYFTATKGLWIDLSIKGIQNTLGAGWDTLRNINWIEGSYFDDVLIGGTDDDNLSGNGGNDILKGGAGNDWLEGGDGNNILNGGTGSDYLRSGYRDDILDGGAGNDIADYWGAIKGVKVDLSIKGKQNTLGAGWDTLRNIENISGSGFDDVLIGDAAENKLWGGAGNDILKGGAGNDVYEFNSSDGTDRINDSAGIADKLSLYVLRQNVSFKVVNGTDLQMNLKANDNSVYIVNGARAGAGMGIETFEFSDKTITKQAILAFIQPKPEPKPEPVIDPVPNSGAGVIVNLASKIEHTSEGNALNDKSLGNKVVFGVKLAEKLVAKTFVTLNFNSSDKSEGRVLTKSLKFDASNWNKAQKLVVQGVDDRDGDYDIAYYIKVTVDDKVNKTTALEYLENDFSIAHINLINQDDSYDAPLTNTFGLVFKNDSTFTNQNDYIHGRNGDDILSGGDRGDNIKGGYGDDNLSGDKHNDRLYGDQGNDILKGGEHNDKLFGGIGNDKLFGEQDNDKLLGGFGNDELNGGTGEDTLNGGAGNDVLIGGTGNDILIGGAGKDLFQLEHNSGVDSIKDFNVRNDSMQLKNFGFNALGQAGVLAATKFRIGNAAQDANDNIIYNKNTGELFYDADGKGGVEAVEIAILGAGLALTNADFLII